jgi:HEAT repeat protein
MMRSKAKPTIPTLQMMLHDPQSYIALEAAGALANVGSESVPGLISALNDSSASVRHAAAYGLGGTRAAARAAIPALVTRLKDPDPQVPASSAYSLTRVASGELHKSRVADQAGNTERQAR